MNKKAQFSEFWVEYVSAAMLIIAFYIAARGAYVGMVYVVALIAGAILGRFWYTFVKKKRSLLYILILTLAIMLGMIVGSIGADRRFIVLLFLIGIAVTYIIHAEKWIKTY